MCYFANLPGASLYGVVTVMLSTRVHSTVSSHQLKRIRHAGLNLKVAPDAECMEGSPNICPIIIFGRFSLFFLWPCRLSKRSWFGHFTSGSSSSSIGSRDRDDVSVVLVMKQKTLNSVKADLLQAFLNVSLFLWCLLFVRISWYHSHLHYDITSAVLQCLWRMQVANLSHAIVSPMRFRCEYRSHGNPGPSVFHARAVRFQVDIVKVSWGRRVWVASLLTQLTDHLCSGVGLRRWAGGPGPTSGQLPHHFHPLVR